MPKKKKNKGQKLDAAMFFGGDDKCCKCQILSRDKQFKDDLAKMKEELGRRQEAKAEVSAAAES